MKYFSYGMLTETRRMDAYCPNATDLGIAFLPNYQLAFNRFATVVPALAQVTEGVLWEISGIDEDVLDVVEGYPSLYDKKIVKVIYDGKLIDAMVYVMVDSEEARQPSDEYYNIIKDGYLQHGIGLNQLDQSFEKTLDKSL